MKTFEEDKMIQEYIYDLCKSKNISIDLRFRCFGDTDIFYDYENNNVFTIDCESYYAKDIEDIKLFFESYLNILWLQSRYNYGNYRIALCVKDIIDKDGWYDAIVGGRLFKDDTLL